MAPLSRPFPPRRPPPPRGPAPPCQPGPAPTVRFPPPRKACRPTIRKMAVLDRTTPASLPSRRGPMIKLTITEKGGETSALSFDQDEVVIGRVQGNDIVLAK